MRIFACFMPARSTYFIVLIFIRFEFIRVFKADKSLNFIMEFARLEYL